MLNVDLQQLVQSLDQEAKSALESAAERCVARGGSEILIEDMMLALVDDEQGFLSATLKQFSISREALLKSLQGTRRQRTAESSNPVFSSLLVHWLQESFMLASLEMQIQQVITPCLLLALLSNPGRYGHTSYYQVLGDIPKDKLKGLVEGLLQDQQQGGESQVAAGGDKGSALASFTTNFTELARQQSIDPVLCRESEIRQMIDILARRRKNNPIVVGEAGVGKTAVVEGLAQRIAAGDVPDVLKGVELLCLDMGLLQAGASVKGEFERRLRAVIDEVKASIKPIILFIDEAHTLIGAGGQAGGSDAANLLKPALARGELRTIAATTWSEYKKYFEKDPALARRFQPVQVLEPTVEQAVTILRGLASRYQQSHGVYLRDDAVVAAAELSARYLSGRQLPDKAVDILDTACARVRISLNAQPALLEDLGVEIASMERQLTAMQADFNAGVRQDSETMEQLRLELDTKRDEYQGLEKNWQQQKEIAVQMLDLRTQLAQLDVSPIGNEVSEAIENTELQADVTLQENISPEAIHGEALAQECVVATPMREELSAHLQDLQSQLELAMEDQQLVSYEVSPELVAEVISAWTGIPMANLVRTRADQITHFASLMNERIKGQDHAIAALDRSVRATATGMGNPNAPTGVFLLVGPSGVGKTETGLAMADLLYGGDRFLTTINMSEFQEKHTLSRLIGSPPGYVGYGEGGVLTEAVRRCPYSVVLLDEVEKADADIMNLFYQVFDKGVANDGEGREIDFKNTVILMTSNLGSEAINHLCGDEERPEPDQIAEAIRPILSQHFKPALLARMTIVPYLPIDAAVMKELTVLKLERLGQRMAQRGLEFVYSEQVVQSIADSCTRVDTGARNIDYIINAHLLPTISDRLLSAQAAEEKLNRLTIDMTEDGSLDYLFEKA